MASSSSVLFRINNEELGNIFLYLKKRGDNIENKIYIYYLEISNTFDANKFNKLLLFASEEKREKIQRFRMNIDKKLSLYAEIIIKTIIFKKLGIKPEKITWEKNKYGKPFLENEKDFHFNLSHTKNAIVVAVSKNYVGIDIEKNKIAMLEISERFFTKSEVAYITKSEININKRFYEIWTKKEAYSKYKGKGLSMSLNKINVLSNRSFQIQTFEKNGYIISVCSKCVSNKYEIIELYEDKLEAEAFKIIGISSA